MRINFFPRQRAAKRSPHSYTAEGGAEPEPEGAEGTRNLGLWHSGTAGPRPEPIGVIFLFFIGTKPGEAGAGCLFVFLFNSWSS